MGKSARLWSSFDAVTPTVETIEFLYSLTRLVKPTNVLETRTWLGLSACAIGRALVENGLGHLTALERDPEAYAVAVRTITQYGLDTAITTLLCSELDFVSDRNYDLAVFDFSASTALAEFDRFKSSLAGHATVVFHGTDDHTEAIRSLVSADVIEGAFLPVPRGIFVGSIKGKE